MALKRKIINDPVHGFITLGHPLLLDVVAHPYYQRLRRIQQMALAYLVYPGAVHTRLLHSLGAYHLMCEALAELRSKGNEITEEEALGAQLAILLHDIGHGPYSHSLEGCLIDRSHEDISLMIMHQLNREFHGALHTAIRIFTNDYPKPFLHQLVSSQLDVDRLDYLSRDSYFTGVSEGVIGYDRIIKMLAVEDGRLVVEEKGLYSIEKFLLARRLMFLQVYLHKTVHAGELTLRQCLLRAVELPALSHPAIDYFLTAAYRQEAPEAWLQQYLQLDDTDVLMAIKNWSRHPDPVLNRLASGLLNRRIFKIRLRDEPPPAEELETLRKGIREKMGLSREDAAYLAFSGEVSNITYKKNEERINILFKDGRIRDIGEIERSYIKHNLDKAMHYICWMD